MKYKNSYNILDKFIAYLRFREVLKKNDFDGKKIIDFGSGSNFDVLKKRYSKTKKAIFIDKHGYPFKNNQFSFLKYEDKINELENDLKNEKFDIILMCAVIEHLDNPESIFNFLKNYLNKNGYFFITAPSKFSKPLLEFLGFKLGIINKFLLAEHKRYYNLDAYEELATRTNLKLINFKYFECMMNTSAILK